MSKTTKRYLTYIKFKKMKINDLESEYIPIRKSKLSEKIEQVMVNNCSFLSNEDEFLEEKLSEDDLNFLGANHDFKVSLKFIKILTIRCVSDNQHFLNCSN
jgi:hypothetical protein